MLPVITPAMRTRPSPCAITSISALSTGRLVITVNTPGCLWSLAVPDRPEHHYRYDPAKSDAYTATTLSWLGDPAAEPYARQVLTRLESASNGPPRPRRAASARLDLSLALIATDQHDEAAGVARHAILSGRIVPSNYWRAREVIRAVAKRSVPEASDLDEAYREFCTGSETRR